MKFTKRITLYISPMRRMPTPSPDSKASRAIATILLTAGLMGLPDGPGRAEGDFIGRMESYRTRYEDTFHEIARRFDLGYVELVAANPGIDPWLPGEGTELILPTAHLLPDAPREGIVINLAEMRLYYFEEPGAAPESYPIAVGREGRNTPLGTTQVVRKAENPTWYPPASIRAEKPELPPVVRPGPDNPLGAHALYLGWPAYLIHGTNKPWGIGRQASAGCIRMYPEDIERLYSRVPVGTPVTVVNQPVKIAWIGDELFVEVHPTDSQAAQLELDGTFDPVASGQTVANIVAQVRHAAGKEQDRLDYQTILEAALERRGYPVQVTR